MKTLQSPQILFLVALFIVGDVMSNNIPNHGWPPSWEHCNGNGALCYGILSIFDNPSSISSGCSSFLQATVTPPQVTSTLTVTLTAAEGLSSQGSDPGQGNPGQGTGHGPWDHLPRNLPGLAGIDCDGPLPHYAGGCIGASQYSSACSCFNITKTTTTLDPQTHTVTEDVTVTPRTVVSFGGSTSTLGSTSASGSFAASTLQSSLSFPAASSTKSGFQTSNLSSITTAEFSSITITAISTVTVTVSQDPITIPVNSTATVTISQNPVTVPGNSTATITISQDPVTVPGNSTATITISQDPITITANNTAIITVSQDPITVTANRTATVTISQDPSTVYNCSTSGNFFTSPSTLSTSNSSSTGLVSGTSSMMATNATTTSSSLSLFSPNSTRQMSSTTTSNSTTVFVSIVTSPSSFSPTSTLVINSSTTSNSSGILASTTTVPSSSNFSTTASSALPSSTCTGYNPPIPTSYQSCLLDPFSSQTFQLLDPKTGIPIVPSNGQAVFATYANNTALGSYHFSQPSNATAGFFDLVYSSSQGTMLYFAVFDSGLVGFESMSSNGNSFENEKFVTTVFSVQCDGELSAGILCGTQFQFGFSTSGTTSTDIAPQSNATVGIPYFGLASDTTPNDPRCPGPVAAVPKSTNTTSPGACASVLGLVPPFSTFQNCCGNIDTCYEGTTTSGIHDCSTTFSTCNTQFFQCAQNACQSTNGTSSLTTGGCQNMANDYKYVLDGFVGMEAFKVANSASCSCG